MDCWKLGAEDSTVDTDKDGIRDLMGDIEASDGVGDASEKDGVEDVQLTDPGLDESDDSSSIVSGPNLLDLPSPEEPGLCQACSKLYLKAEITKGRIKGPLPDNDPRSLTCDEWVLLKKWKPSRLVNTRRKVLIELQFGKQACVQETEPPGCSRTHPFLQRNLRLVKLSQKKRMKMRRNRKKRTKSDSQVSRAAKLQRLGNKQDIRTRHDVDAVSVNCKEMEDKEDEHQTVELIPVSTISGKDPSCEDPPEQTAPKKTRSFRERLATLRGGTIFRETS